jgi:D-lyxose ketol-isomerase
MLSFVRLPDRKWTIPGTRLSRFRIELAVGAHLLADEGDYAMWGPGIGHSWQAEEDSVVVTIRWRSL